MPLELGVVRDRPPGHGLATVTTQGPLSQTLNYTFKRGPERGAGLGRGWGLWGQRVRATALDVPVDELHRDSVHGREGKQGRYRDTCVAKREAKHIADAKDKDDGDQVERRRGQHPAPDKSEFPLHGLPGRAVARRSHAFERFLSVAAPFLGG